MRTRAAITGILMTTVVCSFLDALGAPLATENDGIAQDTGQPGSPDFVTEPEKRVPVAYDVDVVVAGGGISGLFAALAAAREGADTVLVDRFGTVGGNIGPGMNSPEGALYDRSHIMVQGAPDDSVKGGVAGLPKEFAEKFFSLPPTQPRRFLADSNRSVYAAFSMLKEAGVTLVLSTYVGDPILEGNKVRGVFVENKSGRQALKANVVIDATGEADVARRAGAPMLYPKESYHEFDGHAPTGIGIWAVVAGIDPAKYDSAKAGGFAWRKDIGDLAQVDCGGLRDIGPDKYLAGIKAQLVRPHGKVDAGNARHISVLEAAMRMYVFEYVRRCREHLPGCASWGFVSEFDVAGAAGAAVSVAPDGSFSFQADDGLIVPNTGTVAVTVTEVPSEEKHKSIDTPLDLTDAHPKKGAKTTEAQLMIADGDTAITPIGTLIVEISLDDGTTDVTDLRATLSKSDGPSETVPLASGPTTHQTIVFEHANLVGTWTLAITDTVRGGAHTLNGWSLIATPYTTGMRVDLSASSFEWEQSRATGVVKLGGSRLCCRQRSSWSPAGQSVARPEATGATQESEERTVKSGAPRVPANVPREQAGTGATMPPPGRETNSSDIPKDCRD